METGMIPLLSTIVVWMTLKVIVRAMQISLGEYPRTISRTRGDDMVEMFIALAVIAWAALVIYGARP
jgi:hypothetical protein